GSGHSSDSFRSGRAFPSTFPSYSGNSRLAWRSSGSLRSWIPGRSWRGWRALLTRFIVQSRGRIDVSAIFPIPAIHSNSTRTTSTS
ncbi:hypothetical protein PMAYCL1PPCAC_06689, partial [Pristionchus mayeri]